MIRSFADRYTERLARREPVRRWSVEVQRVAGDLVVTLRRSGSAAATRRGLGARLLQTVAEVERSTDPGGAQIALTFRGAGGKRAPAPYGAPGLLDPSH